MQRNPGGAEGGMMLVEEPEVLALDPILQIMGSINPHTLNRRIKAGMYEVKHYGSSHFLPSYEHYPENIQVMNYGVCDYPEQLIERASSLETDPVRKFVVTFTRVTKASQPSDGGWRWHKWGPYIGDKKPTMEYLYDEPEIDEIFAFHIYERK